MKKYIILLQIILAAGVSCSILPRTPLSDEFLPRETDVPGWVPVEQERVTGAKKIAQINPLYGTCDAAEVVTALYHHLSDSSKTVRIHMIKFRSPLDSFGLFSRERGISGGMKFIDDNAYTSSKGMFFRLAKYYVKLTGENLGDDRNGILDSFRTVIADNLKKHTGAENLPDSMFIFSNTRSTREIVYYKQGIETIPGLKNMFVTRHTVGTRKYDVFYSITSSSYEAEHEFHSILKAADGSYILSKIGNIQPAIRVLNEKEHLYISSYKNWIFGVLDAENMKTGNTIIILLHSEIRMLIDKKMKLPSDS
jgi:hypothetical protein